MNASFETYEELFCKFDRILAFMVFTVTDALLSVRNLFHELALVV